jgi:hypothetical protein
MSIDNLVVHLRKKIRFTILLRDWKRDTVDSWDKKARATVEGSIWNMLCHASYFFELNFSESYNSIYLGKDKL